MKFNDFLKSKAAKSGQYKAIIKTLADGREMCLGVERQNSRSRKYKTKYLFDKPIILDELPHRKAERRERDRIAATADGASDVVAGIRVDAASPDAVVDPEAARPISNSG